MRCRGGCPPGRRRHDRPPAPKAWSRAATVGFGLGATTAATCGAGSRLACGPPDPARRGSLRAPSSHRSRRRRTDGAPAHVGPLGPSVPAGHRPRARVAGSPWARSSLALGDEGLDEDRVAEIIAPGAYQPIGPLSSSRAGLAHERPLVSVIIADRDRPAALARCARVAAAPQRYEQFEIIVVDNGSESPDTAELVAVSCVRHPRVRYVWESRLGLAHRHDRASARHTGRFAAFTDDDVVVDEQWLTMIVDAFHEDPAIGCVTGLIAPLELETVSQAWIESSVGFSKGFVLRRFDPAAADPTIRSSRSQPAGSVRARPCRSAPTCCATSVASTPRSARHPWPVAATTSQPSST